uniref:Uncharacterized protein n=1 Tax=Bracon brevicornis TaxID=1563983 RepID=A0A6V7KQ98_9HYME
MVEMKTTAREFAQLLRYLGRSANAAKFWRGRKRYVHAARMVYTFRAPFRLQENLRQRQAFNERQEFYARLRASRGF